MTHGATLGGHGAPRDRARWTEAGDIEDVVMAARFRRRDRLQHRGQIALRAGCPVSVPA
jgi:hypothetical protein